MAITSKDIAQMCGVSRGTVDRALNNKPRINPDTKVRILKMAEELGYRPDMLASSLARGTTMSIGVVVFDIRNRYFAQLLNAIEIEAKKQKYFINITIQENDPELEKNLIHNLVDRRVDGIILCPVNKGKKFNDFIEALSVPVVTIGNFLSKSIPYVGMDERAAIKEATELILTKGYEQIFFVCPPLSVRDKENIYVHEQRLKGFNEKVDEHKDKTFHVIDQKDDYGFIDELLRCNDKKSALLCSGDIFALEILKYLRKKGVKVPRDIGIMGFDGIDILDYVTPALTTVFNPVEAIGIKAVQNLFELIEGKTIENKCLIDYKVINGETL